MAREEPSPEDRQRGFEDYPLTRQEYINVMVHFYRGEIHRSTVWRQRLDATTNWAVLTTAGILSFSFAEFTGSKDGSATYAQYIVKPSWILSPIPDDVSYERASLAGCRGRVGAAG